VPRAFSRKENISRSNSVMRAVCLTSPDFRPRSVLYRDTRSVTPMCHGHGQSVFLSYARSIASPIERGNDGDAIGEHRLVRSRRPRSLYWQEQYFALRDVTNMIEIIRFLMDFRESGNFFAGAYSILFHEAILTLQ